MWVADLMTAVPVLPVPPVLSHCICDLVCMLAVARWLSWHWVLEIVLCCSFEAIPCKFLTGARPIDVASNAMSREYLLTWDPASTDRIKEDKRKAAKNAEKEEKLGSVCVPMFLRLLLLLLLPRSLFCSCS